MRPIYLDNNATTRTDPSVVADMLPYFSEFFGNASSQHSFGAPVAAAVRAARQSLQNLLGAAAESEIVFTSGGTESDNSAILSALETQDGRDEIITTTVEHAAVLAFVGHLEKTRGIKVHYIDVDARGRLDIEAYKRLLGPRTAIVSIMWANNETGTIFPVSELAEVAHAAGALFHTDAVQAVGKLPIDLKSTRIDMLSLSGHKLHGPKGIGALYVRKGVKFKPLIRGGHQERGRRGGTENVPGIIGLGKAAVLTAERFQEELGRVRKLRDRLEQGIVQQIGHCLVNGDLDNRLPNTSNIAFEHLDGEAILTNMDRAGIAASSGSACTAGSTMPSHVLKAMGVPASALQGVVRFSLSRETTSEEIDRVLESMPQIILKLRGMSAHWTHQPSQTDELASSFV
ncbi:cysteine desulfurase NifS [Methylovirgula ligni]|uniref:Cysteine desulfurase n=1 Tax=Methylovirgula ligni TaxID=569860 RepID=A0A3D9Z254_9HYPH|nr:cysteine desulfurase NifS [Methylovirgula ligni]QAY95716.1 cysteine desulfurase NifS [Methylovirgula ligni]REF88915.1 cysteine desulfurase [Methylovirgula ligni]